MQPLQVTARLTVHEGRLEEFRAIAAKCQESVRTKDSGTLQYDWFLNADGTECVVREAYRDSAAVFEHVANLGDLVGALGTVSDLEIELYGTPSPELVEAVAALRPRLYSPLESP